MGVYGMLQEILCYKGYIHAAQKDIFPQTHTAQRKKDTFSQKVHIHEIHEKIPYQNCKRCHKIVMVQRKVLEKKYLVEV